MDVVSVVVSVVAVVVSVVAVVVAFSQARAAKESNKIAREAYEAAIEANSFAKDANKISSDANTLSERALAVSQDKTVDEFAFRLDEERKLFSVLNQSATTVTDLSVTILYKRVPVCEGRQDYLPAFTHFSFDVEPLVEEIVKNRVDSPPDSDFVYTSWTANVELAFRWRSELGVLHTKRVKKRFCEHMVHGN